MMANCPECGKRHVVMWPDLNPFRRGEFYYCSHECWQISLLRDMKSIKDVARGRRRRKIKMKNPMITEEIKAKAVEMAIGGESPLSYLKECGAKNPSATWLYIKKQLEGHDPEKFARLPVRVPKKVKAADIISAVETPEAPKVAPKVVDLMDKLEIRNPLKYEGFTVRAVQGEFGRYSFDPHTSPTGQQYLDYESNGGDELSMTVEQWRLFARELHDAAAVLGVEL